MKELKLFYKGFAEVYKEFGVLLEITQSILRDMGIFVQIRRHQVEEDEMEVQMDTALYESRESITLAQTSSPNQRNQHETEASGRQVFESKDRWERPSLKSQLDVYLAEVGQEDIKGATMFSKKMNVFGQWKEA